MPQHAALFQQFSIRDLVLRNRAVVSPMCQYAAVDGMASDFHIAHLGRFALGGFGMVLAEATAVLPEARSTPFDLGLWEDDQIPPLRRVAAILKAQGALAGIQLGHAGAKGGLTQPWAGSNPSNEAFPAEGERWDTVSPSGIPTREDWPRPRAMTCADIERVVFGFAEAARRADDAGFDFIEIHAGHGYLISQFLSPLTNLRDDSYGGEHSNRMRLALEVVEAIRSVWPEGKGLGFRVSAVDTGGADGTTIEDTVALAIELGARGVDVIDCSSGGVRTHPLVIPVGPGYQASFAARVRRDSGVASMAVGLLDDPHLAEQVLANGMADLVAVGRGALDDPNWVHHAHDLLSPDPGFNHWPDRYRWGLEHRAQQLGRGQVIDLD